MRKGIVFPQLTLVHTLSRCSWLAFHLILTVFHRLTVVSVSFCSLIKRVTRKLADCVFVLMNSVLLNHFCVWIADFSAARNPPPPPTPDSSCSCSLRVQSHALKIPSVGSRAIVWKREQTGHIKSTLDDELWLPRLSGKGSHVHSSSSPQIGVGYQPRIKRNTEKKKKKEKKESPEALWNERIHEI